MVRLLKKLTNISGTVIRLTIGIGGAALVFLALKENNKKDISRKLNPKS